ncbi:MAG: F0F1 ATP synthase subunit B [Paludibacter sp.]|nr:F0F1 ATP synthase subunit B [Paludibacter sp.]MBP7613499.1 F0F1 ATP synthase subunit B [Paludibacter sp.]
MSLLTPDSGLLFWMLISFGIVVFVLAKFGFPIILKMVEERKEFIEDALLKAEKARTELDSVKAEAELILDKARKEHQQIMNEASQLREVLIQEAKTKAIGEADKIIENARLQIQNEKDDAIRDIRKQVAGLSVDIAEKVLRNKLDKKEEQLGLIQRLIDEMNISKS